MRGKAPSRLLNHSILTPSLAASIFTAKYINAVPLNRISEGYGYDGLNISRQVMAGWMIRLSDYYLDSVHQMMKDELKKAPLIHCDESPFTMSGEKDANDPQSKNYMWVYHSPGIQDSKKIYLYEYDNGSRSAAVIDRYLEGYKGILVSDGYASYHTLDRKQLHYPRHSRSPERLRKESPLFSIRTISARANRHRRFLITDSYQ